MKTPTYNEIKPYIEKGLIREDVHPEDNDVHIFNYTQKAQFDKVWDNVTKQCRGLIMNIKTGEVLARPFPKFYNYQEYVANGWEIPKGMPQITEKLDGSLGIMYTLNGKTWISTRGAFMSEQAVWATEWWRDNKGDEPYGNEFTHLLEIIYPENRIVVNYDFSGVVHLASLDTKTGFPVDYMLPVRGVRKINANNLDELLAMDEPNSEGFVIYWPEEDVRMKIKFPEYVRLHKLVTGVSEIAIWEHLKEGKSLDGLLEKVPDEFMKWVTSVEKRIREDFLKVWGAAQLGAQMVPKSWERKEQALYILDNYKYVSGLVFSLLDGNQKKAAESAWKMVRPHGNSQFKNDVDL